MKEELQRRNYSEITGECYVRHVAEFANHFNRSPELMGAEEIKQFQLHLINDKKVAWSTYIQAMAAVSVSQSNFVTKSRAIDTSSSERVRTYTAIFAINSASVALVRILRILFSISSFATSRRQVQSRRRASPLLPRQLEFYALNRYCIE
jgi:hypothetical protein